MRPLLSAPWVLLVVAGAAGARAQVTTSPPPWTAHSGLIDPRSLRATASSTWYDGVNPMQTVNGAGLHGDAHDNGLTTAWQSSHTEHGKAWFRVDLGRVIPVGFMKVWNLNWTEFTRRGAAEADLYVSDADSDPGNPVDHPANWRRLAEHVRFSRASHWHDYGANPARRMPDVIPLGGVRARYVALQIRASFNGRNGYVGLSEVQFSTTPFPTPRTAVPASPVTDAVRRVLHDFTAMDALPAGLVQTTNVEARLAAADKPRALRLREGAGSERYAWLVPPSGFWDLADYRYIEIPLVNRGSRDVYLTCWAYVPGGWGAAGTYPVDSDGNVFLEPDETTTVWMDLHRHRPGNEAWAPVIDPSRVARVEIIFRSREPGAVVEVPVVAAVGRGPGERHDLSGRLIVPEVTPGDPAAGRRVRRLPPDCSCATVPYILYLPTDWEPGTRYPFIVEFAGARHFHLDCYSPGKAEQGTLGYGMSRGRGFIWVNVPFLEPGGRSEALGSWGDPDLTARHCLDVVRDVCERYGGDPGAGFVTGFSRGAYACSYIALRNDDIADVWLGFHLNQGHAHGDWLGCATGAAGRTARLKGRAVFLTNAGWAGAANVEDVDAGVGGHTDAALLEERPSTLACRAWLRRVLAERPGTRRVSGRVRGPDGQGVAGVRVESGPTHFAVTEADGGYVLPGLVDGEREVRARLTGWSFAPPRREVRLAGADVDGVDFAATREE